ncbi:MAG: hypothetical protein AAF618_00840 [Pseudomonadota bacterium]
MGMFSKLPALEEQERRFVILAHLDAMSPVREISDMFLADACTAQGVPSGIEEVVESLAWLAKEGYVATQTRGAMQTAELLRKGLEVVKGNTSPEGFRRPRDFTRRS